MIATSIIILAYILLGVVLRVKFHDRVLATMLKLAPELSTTIKSDNGQLIVSYLTVIFGPLIVILASLVVIIQVVFPGK